MEHLVYWNCKEKNSALPKQINEFGDTVGLEDICAQLATIYDIVGDMSLDRLRELVEADKDGRCIILPKVNMRSKKIFSECLEDAFKEWSYSDPSVGLYGMTEDEKTLASAIMDALKKGDLK